MFIVELTYKVPISEVEKYLAAHREFLDYYYKLGLILASGPMNPRTGGIVIALVKDREYLESILTKDPFHQAEISEYHITEFMPVMHCAEIKNLITKAEGNLC
ncbi:MAG: GTP cyclohydrolase [Legionellales bacterium RIFCSPHIGHO2_12_FULL_35_11]|nr:MAG: GTP cyclohydrolase [Legionellales bacterium RIFCSPHIGHO2_12_FULL_35_11]